jgi:hypothetical protein
LCYDVACVNVESHAMLYQSLIVILLFVASCCLCSSDIERLLRVLNAHFDLPTLLCVLILVGGSGLLMFLLRPPKNRTDVSGFFGKLALGTLAFGVLLPIATLLVCMTSVIELEAEVYKWILKSAMLAFLYSGWLALLVFVPLSYRFSGGIAESKLRPYFIASALLGIGTFFCIFAGQSIVLMQIPVAESTRQFSDEILGAGISIFPMLWDLPSLVLVWATLAACRLGMGKLQNHYDWIPVSIFIGLLWGLQGMIFMMNDPDPEKFVAGTMVASLTVFYACVFALAVLVNRLGFFTALAAVMAIFLIVLVILVPGEFTPAAILQLTVLAAFIVFMSCWFGFFCDYLHYFVVRYESFGKLSKNQKYLWIAASVVALVPPAILFVTLFVWYLLLALLD